MITMDGLRPDAIYTPEEVAQRFRVSAAHVRQQLRDGLMMGRRTGRHWKIKGKDAEAWFDAQQTPSTDTDSSDTGETTSPSGMKTASLGRLNLGLPPPLPPR